MLRNFLFMRHGESTANVEGICAGGDTRHPLTQTGRAQARQAAAVLQAAGTLPQRIIHSHQIRAAQTAELVRDGLAIAPDQVSGDGNWRERGFGRWEGTPFLDIRHHLEDWIDPPEGEPLPDLFSRVTAGLAALPQGLTLVVSHGGLWHVLNKLHGVSQAPHIGNAEIFSVTVASAVPTITSTRIV